MPETLEQSHPIASHGSSADRPARLAILPAPSRQSPQQIPFHIFPHRLHALHLLGVQRLTQRLGRAFGEKSLAPRRVAAFAHSLFLLAGPRAGGTILCAAETAVIGDGISDIEQGSEPP